MKFCCVKETWETWKINVRAIRLFVIVSQPEFLDDRQLVNLKLVKVKKVKINTQNKSIVICGTFSKSASENVRHI